MHSLRQAFIAAFLLLAAFQGSATAAHCRSEHVLVLDESTGRFDFGTYDPNRLSWEPIQDGAELAWGFSCQEGEPSSSRTLSGTHILADGSTGSVVPSPVTHHYDLTGAFLLSSNRWAPDPRPPRS